MDRTEDNFPEQLNSFFSVNFNRNPFQVADFNGDGKADILRFGPGFVTTRLIETSTNNEAIVQDTHATDFFLDDPTRAFHQQSFSEKIGEFGGGSLQEFGLTKNKDNIHVGDFNGDGRDDFLSQEKRSNTAKLFISEEPVIVNRQDDKKETKISFAQPVILPKNFDISGTRTILHIGDFNDDGSDDFLRQEKGSNTANIFLSKLSKDGSVSFDEQPDLDLPDAFDISGNLANLHIGDFNGDGSDDFLRQEKGRLDDDNIGTAQIFLSNVNDDGSVSFDRRINLPEAFDIKGDQTDLYVGNFNGDEYDDFLRVARTDSGLEHKIFFSEGDGTFRAEELFIGRRGLKQDVFETNSTLRVHIADINGDGKDDIVESKINQRTNSRLNSTFLSHGNGDFIRSGGTFGKRDELDQVDQYGDFDGNGNHDLLRLEESRNEVFLTLGRHISGTGIIHGSAGDDEVTVFDSSITTIGDTHDTTVYGGRGNDTITGNNGFDTAGYQGDLDRFNVSINPDQTITVADLKVGRDDNEGVDTLTNIEQLKFGDDSTVDITFGDDSDNALTGSSSIDVLFGGEGNDTLVGGEGDDSLDGGKGDDSLEGGAGKDVLRGGEGNDTLVGGTGGDVASFEGNFEDFTIVFNDDGSIKVTDNNIDDGNEGTDTLENISLLSFGDTTSAGNNQLNTVTAVAGVTSNPGGSSRFISGGEAQATNFIIDIEGKTGPTLDFNNQQLADFINFIALPDQEIEKRRLAANLMFDALGGALGATPIAGPALATGVALEQVRKNYEFDLEQVEAQKQAADDAVRNFDSLTFGKIDVPNRETVVIEDFQIGVDNLFLPSVEGGLEFTLGASENSKGQKVDGVFIKAQGSPEESAFVFIVDSSKTLTGTEFLDQFFNLRTRSGDTGTVIGTFQNTIQTTGVDVSGRMVFDKATFAGDVIAGENLSPDAQPDSPNAGSHQIEGQFGDDFLLGADKNDVLFGGFAGDGGPLRDPATGERTLDDSVDTNPDSVVYQDDGFDTLQGGLGDDSLIGGSGNDVLDGGGFINPFSDQKKVLTNDGTDTLTGGSGNDIFVFNTLETGLDIITDFQVGVDKIRVDSQAFGNITGTGTDADIAADFARFSFDNTTGVLSFDSQQFALLQGVQGFDNFGANIEIFNISQDVIL